MPEATGGAGYTVQSQGKDLQEAHGPIWPQNCGAPGYQQGVCWAAMEQAA